MENKESVKNVIRITAILMIITTVTAVLLAVINMFTEPVIAGNTAKAKQDAILEIFPDADDTLSLADDLGSEYPKEISDVYAVFRGGELIGYCADVASMGFSDNIGMMVGVDLANAVRGIKILEISDTPGLGMKVNDEAYLSSYISVTGEAVFGGNVDAISGATFSSKGVRNGVNTALSFCAMIRPGSGEEAVG